MLPPDTETEPETEPEAEAEELFSRDVGAALRKRARRRPLGGAALICPLAEEQEEIDSSAGV